MRWDLFVIVCSRLSEILRFDYDQMIVNSVCCRYTPNRSLIKNIFP
jgi:hypothetical protein